MDMSFNNNNPQVQRMPRVQTSTQTTSRTCWPNTLQACLDSILLTLEVLQRASCKTLLQDLCKCSQKQ